MADKLDEKKIAKALKIMELVEDAYVNALKGIYTDKYDEDCINTTLLKAHDKHTKELYEWYFLMAGYKDAEIENLWKQMCNN
tara:strand:+ start:1593 stop:1838 length:246 start_codon:yes stop_codon:yes gene_type:complete